MVPLWSQAAFWGLVAGSALVLGAAIAYFTDLPHRLIAAIMGFGAGVLISVLSFELLEEAYTEGGFGPATAGFLGGAALFSAVNWYLSRRGAEHRKRCGGCVEQPAEADMPGSGLAIAVGALLDGVPESIAVGLSLADGGAVSAVAVAGFFLANVPEGLSSAAGMKQAGRSAGYIFGIWSGIAVLSGVAALLGYAVFGGFSPAVVAATTALAAGGVLATLAETMIPEAFDQAPHFIGLITATGFLVAFTLTQLSG
ncbi:MAG: ZIP family zinc transporter [Chloroflexi bacterium]|nr:ZIP family zinc transporter [Chloroflexota bacterium]